MNDIIIFNRILKKYIVYLHIIFELFDLFNITLSLKKIFDYFIVILLKQKIDVFDLITTTNKFKTILKLNFSHILKNLKNYLNFID